MSRGKKKKRSGDGPGVWWLVIGPAIIFVAIPMMIWEAVTRFISRSLPGGRDRQAGAELRRIDRDIASARKLASVLAPDVPEIETKLVKYADRARRKIERHAAKGGWAEDLDLGGGVWDEALSLLGDAGRVAVLDWKSGPGALKRELSPLLQRYGVALDWSFLSAPKNDASPKTWDLLTMTGEQVAALGHVLVNISYGSDSYSAAVVTPAEFALIDGLSDSRNDYSVGKY